MRTRIGPFLIFLFRKTKEYQMLEARFKRHHDARERYGAIYQDFHERQEGEIFCGNFTQEEFDALSLKTKRINGPARDVRLGKLYRKIPGFPQPPEFGVYVMQWELESLGVRYAR